MRTPNPTVEELLELDKQIEREKEFINLEDSPLLSTQLFELDIIEGIRSSQAALFHVNIDPLAVHRVNKSSYDSQPKRPDRINISNLMPGAANSKQDYPTHFFVTDSGEICFSIYFTERIEYLGPGITRRVFKAEEEHWIVSEAELNQLEKVVADEIKEFIPFAKARDLISERNKKWAREIPQELNLAVEKFQLHKIAAKSKAKKSLSKALPTWEQIVWLSNHAPDRDFMRALASHPEGFSKNVYEGHYFNEGKEGTTTQYQPPEIAAEFESGVGNAPLLALDALDQRFKAIKSDLTADVVDILYHHWERSGCTANSGPARITLSQIVQYRGLKPEGDNLKITLHAVLDARSMRLKNSGVDDAILNISSIELNQLNLFGHGIPADADTLFIYSPGFIVQWGLQGNQYFSAPFVQSLWALSPKDHNEAKRIGRFLRGDWRMNTQKYFLIENGERPSRWFSWESILRESGISIDDHRNGTDPGRLIKRVEKAVSTLYNMNIIADGDFHIYHPDDRQIAENLPRKGRLEKWLSLRVCLAPAASIRDALRETDGNRRKRQQAIHQASARKTLREKPTTKKKSSKNSKNSS